MITFLAIGTNAFGQPTARIAKSPTEFVPAAYVVFQKIQGDLNGDNQADYVFIIKGTDKSKFVKDEYRGELDRNRRGIIVVLSSQNGYELAIENRDCFSSEIEDGGVYYAPELVVSVEKGTLRVHYAHGRYGYWSYSFRYQNSDFELIGYDSSQNRGPVVERSISINLMTKKMRIRENVNANAEGGGEKFKENWKNFSLVKPIKLRQVADFDNFDLEGFLGLLK
ncbi:MAG: hypothetical protein ACK5TK_08070 [Betaproteobacteria bacterium]